MNHYIYSLFDLLNFDSLGIEEIQITEFPPNELLQENKTINSELIDTALTIRKKLGTPFWDSLLTTFLNPELENDYEILSYALRHNPIDKILRFSKVSGVLEYIQNNPSKNIALLSEVKIAGGSKMHIPMIDFHIPVLEKNNKTVEKVLEKLELNYGVIVNSGKSYHFIGTRLISSEDMTILLGKMILLTPIIDKNWIAHQLIEKKTALRITKGGKSNLHIIKHIL